MLSPWAVQPAWPQPGLPLPAWLSPQVGLSQLLPLVPP
jgi:hypothetical protein